MPRSRRRLLRRGRCFHAGDDGVGLLGQHEVGLRVENAFFLEAVLAHQDAQHVTLAEKGFAIVAIDGDFHLQQHGAHLTVLGAHHHRGTVAIAQRVVEAREQDAFFLVQVAVKHAEESAEMVAGGFPVTQDDVRLRHRILIVAPAMILIEIGSDLVHLICP